MSATTGYCSTETRGEKVSQKLNNWGACWGLAFLCLLIAALYARVLADLVFRCWHDEQMSQALLMPPLAVYVAWTRRTRLLSCPIKAEKKGLIWIGLACLMFLTGKLGAELSLPRISFVVLTGGLIWTFWGRARLRILLLPLLLLATMVPIPTLIYNSVSIPLKLVSSTAATKIAQTAGIVVYQDGNVLQLPRMSLGIEDACNGVAALSCLIASALLLGLLFAHRRAWLRVTLIFLAIPIAVAVNVIRIAGTAIIADSHPQFAIGFYHAFSGWLVYLFGLVALYLAARLLDAATRPARPQGAAC
jgi:exosortase